MKVQNTYLDRTGTENHLKEFESRGLAPGRDLFIDSFHVCGEGSHCVALFLVPLLTIKMN